MNLRIIYWILFFSISLGCYLHIGWFCDRSNFVELISVFVLLFIGYFLQGRYFYINSVFLIFFSGIIFRLIFLLSNPSLSDDYHRFIWDARQVYRSHNPYQFTPNECGVNDQADFYLMDRMNSPNYYSVYPPLQQLFFLPSGATDKLGLSLILLHLIVFFGEVLLFYFLMKSVQLSVLSWIWLNPLWIIEVNGNLHFEGWMLTLVAAGIYFLQKNKNYVSALFFSFAAGLKLIPLLVLPMIKKWKGMRTAIIISIVSFVLFIIPFLLFIYPHNNNFLTSLDLYYHKFEFNASFYFILKWIGFQFSDLHPIVYSSQILITIFLVFYTYLFFKSDEKNLSDFFLTTSIAFTAYYLLATTVHPWYILTVLFFSVLSGKYYGIIWSGLVFLSYAAYSGNETLYYYMVSIEYFTLFVFMFLEHKNKLRLTQPA